MTYWDGRDPSGKAIACSMLALILVFGSCAFVVWADHNDGITSHSKILDDYSGTAGTDFVSFNGIDLTLTDSEATADESITVYTPAENDGSYHVALASSYEVSKFSLIANGIMKDASRVEISLPDLDVSSVKLNYCGYQDGFTSYFYESMTREGDVWVLELGSLDQAFASEAGRVNIDVRLNEPATIDGFSIGLDLYEKQTVVPLGTVMILTGIVLVFGAVYATPYVSFGDLTRWGEKGVKGAYRGGKKMINGRRK